MFLFDQRRAKKLATATNGLTYVEVVLPSHSLGEGFIIDNDTTSDEEASVHHKTSVVPPEKAEKTNTLAS